MKKVGVLSLLSLIGLAAFAAFPVMESGLVESVLVDNETTNSPLATWSLVLGIIWFPTLLIGALMSWGGPELFGGVLMIAGMAFFIGAIITGIISLFNEKTGRWKAFVGLALSLGILLLSIFSSLLADGGSLFY
ncbi:MAG: hypothetical protein HOB54_04270 [Flavobacteriales bacterium]|jgi:hypothetical protein|nr:hypothetical protein [Flavobacteriales bacterium]MBT6650568.1 hypothetical protein [Flavobacteriales bacterium]MBT6965254.1 hypothetical protein [Flavobacteriales bacterium]